MKTIKEILILVKKEFNRNLLDGYEYIGLCETVSGLSYYNIITPTERLKFNNYWDKYAKTHKQFYDIYGNKINDNWMLAWKPYSKPYRNKWLNKHIKLNL